MAKFENGTKVWHLNFAAVAGCSYKLNATASMKKEN